MSPPSIEQALHASIDEEIMHCGENHIAVALRLNDLAKYLASQKRFSDAEPVMEQAVFVVAFNTLKAGLAKPSEDAAPIIDGYEILLKVLGVDREQRLARLQAAMDRANAEVETTRNV
jgi:hypothetical protein